MGQDSDTAGLGARRAALRMISAATDEGRLLSDVLPGAVAHLNPADRARAGRLASETLRWASRADRVLGPYLRKRPQPQTHDALRMAVWEICADGSAPHGVVNAAVTLLGEREETKRQAGLANAVLRKIAGARVDWHGLPLPQLPKWLRKPLLADYGKAAVAGIEAAHANGAPLDLTLAPDAPDGLCDALGGETLSGGTIRLMAPGAVSALPGYSEGQWWVQDWAAALPARCLAAQPGERVLDLCAAPGGKTMQLAATGAQVTSLDISERRMERVAENLGRTGLSASLVVADALEWDAEDPFDAVLLDAPCSATGTIRRHPDLPHAKDGTDFPGLFELQSSLIDRAILALKPGGRLVFCTCSLLIDEGEEQVRDALARHPGLFAEQVAPVGLGLDPGWSVPEGIRLRPDYWADRGGMDGFFVATLRKPAEEAGAAMTGPV
ncbi:MAG: transcription antitermination factor NusB [Pseudomonadota bacterium]